MPPIRHLSMEKEKLRQRMRLMKAEMTRGYELAQSADITSQLLSLPVIMSAGTILMYHSLPGEVCTRGAIDNLFRQGKTILLPHVAGRHAMELRVYAGEEWLERGAYGIMEPSGATFTGYGSIDVAVVPGMAFDKGNNRLGRGKGYYDRLLRRIPSAYKIGLCFGFQLVDHIDTDASDVPMDCVLSSCASQ